MTSGDPGACAARAHQARVGEAGAAVVERVPAEPFDTFSERFVERARSGEHDFIFVSQMLFGSGRRFESVDELAELARLEGPWVMIDGYHAFMAIEAPFGGSAPRSASPSRPPSGRFSMITRG